MKKIYYWIMRKLYPKDSWFWTEGWQAEEQKVDNAIKKGEGKTFNSMDEFIDSLDDD